MKASKATVVGCPNCGDRANADHPTPVYAVGQIVARFPSVGTEKEMAQVVGRGDHSGLTDQRVIYEALKEHRYLARQMCYIMMVGGLETYLLRPRDSMDWDLLVDAVRPNTQPGDVDAVVGRLGPLAPPDMCNGLTLPIVVFDQIYSFDMDELRASIPRDDGVDDDVFRETADEILRRVLSVADNAGATDEDRAMNYLLLRYDRIYGETAQAHAQDESLTAIEARLVDNQSRRLVDVVLAFTNRTTDVTRRMGVRVDVTEPFPFLVSKLSPYLDRASY